MLHRAFLVPLVLVVLVSASLAGSPRSDVADALMDKFAQAWSKKDQAAVLAMLADDVTLVTDKALVGAEVVAWVKQQLPGTTALTITSARSEVVGDVAYQLGQWKLGLKSGGTETGSHLFVFRKVKGAWRLVAMEIGDDAATK